MRTQDLPFGSNDEPIRIDPQGDRPVYKRCRHAVTVAFKGDEAGWRDTLALLDEAVERQWQRHERRPFISKDIGDRSRQRAVRASRTFFSTCRFSQPEAGLQNSGVNT
jgi:hypothetical protein